MTLEEQYKQETGQVPYRIIDNGIYGKFLKREYNPKYVCWLEHKANLLTLAVERFMAGEELRICCRSCLDNDSPCWSSCKSLAKLQDAIAAYEAAVKGEGE